MRSEGSSLSKFQKANASSFPLQRPRGIGGPDADEALTQSAGLDKKRLVSAQVSTTVFRNRISAMMKKTDPMPAMVAKLRQTTSKPAPR